MNFPPGLVYSSARFSSVIYAPRMYQFFALDHAHRPSLNHVFQQWQTFVVNQVEGNEAAFDLSVAG